MEPLAYGTPADSLARQTPPLSLWVARVRIALRRLRLKLPMLVWYGQEIDVLVTFPEARLPSGLRLSADEIGPVAFSLMNEGHLAKIERDLAEIGVEFDKGAGPDGRDWEWDFSLRGPISVKFKGTASQPERRSPLPSPGTS